MGDFNFRYLCQQRGPNKGQTVYLCLLAKSLKCISEELPKSPMSVCTLQTCEYFHMEIGIMPLPRVGSHSIACSSKRTPVVWPSSQLFMCWGSWAKTWCQVIVLSKNIKKKVKVWFSLHDMCFSLSSWNPLEVYSQGWTGLLACSAATSPPLLLFTK